jgi:TatD family-associated radical SAM protein
MHTIYKDNLYINLTNRSPTAACSVCAIPAKGWAAQALATEGACGAGHHPANERIPIPQSYNEVVFCGFGEPTERLDALLEVHAYAKSLGKTVRLDTNGLANLIHGRGRDAAPCGLVDIVSISLNATDAKKYDALCRSRYGERHTKRCWISPKKPSNTSRSGCLRWWTASARRKFRKRSASQTSAASVCAYERYISPEEEHLNKEETPRCGVFLFFRKRCWRRGSQSSAKRA